MSYTILEAGIRTDGDDPLGYVVIRKTGATEEGVIWGEEYRVEGLMATPLYDWQVTSWRTASPGEEPGPWEAPDEAVRPLSMRSLRDRVELALRRAREDGTYGGDPLRHAAAAAVSACLPLLPLTGSDTTGYRVNEAVDGVVAATGEEWAGAAQAIAELHQVLGGLE